ncbi:MAG: efflux RND transporter periplasmic adaptor subunit [Planctomycetes bacterium]|nr:efflux RND transporter periplasmic adaptor subunit [Planctomycetota bacterium]
MKFKAVARIALRGVLPAVAGLVLLVLVTAWLAGAFTKKIPGGSTAATGGRANSPSAQETYKVQEIEKAYIEEAIGTLKAASRTEISARVLASIERIAVSSNDVVAQGDVLIELDRRAVQAQLSQAEADLEATAAVVAQAQDIYDRAVRLRTTNPGTIAEQDFNQMHSNLLAAQANENRVQQAVAEAQVRLAYTTIKAPKSGTIVDRWAEEGDVAQPGEPLLSLYDRTSLRLEVPVMENLAVKIHKRDTLVVHIDALDRDIEGIVDEKVPQAEAATRSFLVKVKLPPSDELYEGMFGRLMVPAGTRRHLCLHTGAVRRVGQLDFVTVEDSKTGEQQRRFIRLGRFGDATHREVLSGLEAGDVVLLNPPDAS